jgi:hypothetical protein
METSYEPLHLRQIKFGTDHGHIHKFYVNYYFDEAVKCGDDDAKF